THRSTPFPSLAGLTTLTTDFSRLESFTHPTKFFHESTFDSHYDGRFASAELPHHTRALHLRVMLKAYMETMERIRIRTWLMHGCLLGWWWNGRIMPWDADVDVMVDERGMRELGTWWNMTVHAFTASDLLLLSSDGDDVLAGDGGKRYLLEVNPHYMNASTRDVENVIDARWIDVGTGLYIDITTVHVQPTSSAQEKHNGDDDDDGENDTIDLYTKDQHAYSSAHIFPLRTTTFEDTIVHVPYEYEELLLDEYGGKALTETWFRGWAFDKERREWVLTAEGEEEERW
ncbi:LicD family-domain-containing protein, partial [Phaeosphaeriaceae sp. PMI808]